MSTTIIYGDDESYIASNIAGVEIIPPVPVFGDDIIYGSNKTDEIYGDLGLISLTAEAGEDVSVTLDDIVMVLGNDELYGGNGKDVLVGDVGDVTIQAFGGTSFILNANADVEVSITTGVDILNGGHGDDELYGDVKTMTIDLQGGDAFLPYGGFGSSDSNAQFRSNTITFGDDGDDEATEEVEGGLFGGNGNDELTGDVGEMVFNLIAGNAGTEEIKVTPYVSANAIFRSNVINFGDDDLYGGNGNDVLTGDVNTMTFYLEGGFKNEGSATANDSLNEYNFGVDHLDGGAGDDFLYGDAQCMTYTLLGGIASGGGFRWAKPNPFQNDFYFGSDHLDGGSGNDFLYGDVEHMIFTLTGGIGLDGPAFPRAAAADFAANRFHFGSDHLDGGSGDDFLYGDVEQMTFTLQGGSSPEPSASAEAIVVSVDFNFGADELIGGNGNDVLVGDVGVIEADLMGGDGAQGRADARFEGQYFTFGDDVLHGGAGADSLYGDVISISFSGIGGEGYANAEFSYSQHYFGDDDLYGGAGADFLYGDVESISFSAIGGGAVADFYYNEYYFGDDELYGGDGDDYIVGDLDNYSEYLEGSAFIDTELYFGNDLLEGGLGNDYLDGNGGIDTASYANANGAVYVNLAMNMASGADGNDQLYNIENVIGSAYGDTLTGDDQDNVLEGGAGMDVLNGDAGNDVLEGGAGNDTLNGGADDDILEGGQGADTLDGGAGVNTLSYASSSGAVMVDLGAEMASGGDTQGDSIVFSSFANVIGSGGSDTLIGNDQDNALIGDGGFFVSLIEEDFESGSLGSEWTIISSEPEGRIQITDAYGAASGDYALLMDRDSSGAYNLNEAILTVDLDASLSYVLSFSYADWEYSFAADELDPFFENSMNGDGVSISDGIEDVDGNITWHTILNAPDEPNGVWNDFSIDLTAAAAAAGIELGDSFQIKFQQYDNSSFPYDGRGYDNIAIIEVGDDILEGGEGNDVLDGGFGFDTASYANAGIGGVMVDLSNNEASGADGDDELYNIEKVIGSAHSDTLIGDDQANVFEGGVGADTLQGGLGNDTLDGGVGGDILEGGEGDDTLIGGVGADVLQGGAGNDVFEFDVASGFGQDEVMDFEVFQHPANGTWTLSVDDDYASSDDGWIANGWELEIVTDVDTYSFANTTYIPIEGPTITSDVAVSGVEGEIQDIIVSLKTVYHTWFSDIDAHLTAPGDVTVELFTDTNGSDSADNGDIILDDNAAVNIKYAPNPVEGTYTTEPGDALATLPDQFSVDTDTLNFVGAGLVDFDDLDALVSGVVDDGLGNDITINFDSGDSVALTGLGGALGDGMIGSFSELNDAIDIQVNSVDI